MTPASKEEIYLAKLCGEDWNLPYPASRLEYYYAKLCGMDIPLPAEPLSRPELYLAYLCGMDVKLPKPVSRKEMYMAKVCGMEMEKLPEPLSTSEKYWYMYIHHIRWLIQARPIPFKSNGSDLLDYRIYAPGSADETVSYGTLSNEGYQFCVITSGKNLFDYRYVFSSHYQRKSDYFAYYRYQLHPNTYYTFSTNAPSNATETTFMFGSENVMYVADNGVFSGSPKIIQTDESGILFIAVRISGGNITAASIEDYENGIYWAQLEQGESATPYEIYHEPITTTLSIGSQPLHAGEYLHYGTQKKYHGDGTATNLFLPAIPTFEGTTVIDWDIEAIPAKMDLQYHLLV